MKTDQQINEEMESENTHEDLLFKCSICVETFSYVLDLYTHIVSHDVQNTYKCKFCTYMCRDIQELEAHMFTHNVNKPYSCGLCEDKFADISELLQHLENYHDRVQNIPNEHLCTSQSVFNGSDTSSQNYVNGNTNSSFASNQATAVQNVTTSNCADNQTNAFNNSVNTVATSYADFDPEHMPASYANFGAEQSATSSFKGEQTNSKLLGSSIDNMTANVKALTTSNNFYLTSTAGGHHQTTASDLHKYKQEARSDSENVSPTARRTHEATASYVRRFKQEQSSDAEHATNESAGDLHAYGHIRSSNADANLQASGFDGFYGCSGSQQNNEDAGSECPKSIEKQPCSFIVTENSLLQESTGKDKSTVIPSTEHMFSSYVKLEKISPKASEKQSRSASSQKSDQSKGFREPNSVARTEDQVNHQKLERDPPGIILTELDKLKLCLSCCYPYSVSRGHDCLKSSMLSRKCGFCEVVFNNTWSLASHSLKIHQERKNFCCVICSLVLRSEWDYIQHFINVHRKEIKSQTTRTFHRHTKHVNSVVSTVVLSQPEAKSRRFKGSPRKVVQRSDSISHDVIDDSSDEDYHPENDDLDSFGTSHAVKMTDDNLAEDIPQGVNVTDLANDNSKQNIETNADEEHRKITQMITTLDTNTSQIAPGFKRNISHGRSQSSKIRKSLEDMSTVYSVCHNCCFVVQNILEHLKMHPREERLKCGFCGLHLKTEAAARHHYRNSHKQCNKINCNTCQWFGVSEKAYIKHCLMVHHRVMNLAVPKELREQGIDSPTVPTSSNLVNSIMKNRRRRDKNLLCRFCSVVSLNLLEHYKTHKNSEFLKCGFCLKTFPDREKVVSHFANTHRRNGLACKTCSSFVGSEGMYIEHYLKNHIKETAITSASSIWGQTSTFTNENNAPLAWDKSNNDSSLLSIDDDPDVRGRLSQPIFPRLSSQSNLFLDPADQDGDTADLRNATQGLPIETAASTGHQGPRDQVQPSKHQSIPNDASQLSICRHCCELHPTSVIKLHMKCHSAEERSQCGFCNKEFAIIDDVWRHQQKSHMDHLKCPFCSEELTSMDNYKDHFLQKHYLDLQNDTLKTTLRCFVCEFCGVVVGSKKAHNKIHNDCVICAFCKLDFSRKSSVTQHFMEKHKALKFLPCLFCQNFVGSLNKYIKHFLLHHSPGFELKKNEVFPVSDGEEEGTSDGTLQKHVGLHRKEQPILNYSAFFNEGRTVETDSLSVDESVPKCMHAPTLPLPLPAPYLEAIDVQNLPQDTSNLSVCRHCCQLHPKSIIKTHMRNHSLLERSQCGFCDKEFTLIDDVWRHQQKSHMNQWMCPFCSMECESLDSYKGHFLDKHYLDLQNGRLKTKLRYFVCEFCGDVHKSRKLHNRTHCDSDFNNCGFCNSKFNRKSVVIQHFAGRHRDRRTLTCPICQQFIGSENKYIKHYLLNHAPDFMLQENQVFVSSDPEDELKASEPANRLPGIQNENNQPIINAANEFHSDDEEECVNQNDEFQKYFVCEFCGEIHKSLKDHYPTHKDFTLCAFCDIELANKRNIQRHYKYKHKMRKNLKCKSCSVTIGSEKEYIDHCLQQHKREESSDEDEFEKDLCSQIENVFQNPDAAQMMNFQDNVMASTNESIAQQDVTFKNISQNYGKRRNDDASDTISKRIKKQPLEDHIGERNFDQSNMFSDDSNSMPSLPDFALGDDDDAEDDMNPLDHEDTYTQITSKSSMLAKVAKNCAPIADLSDSSKTPSMTKSRTRPLRRNSTIPASDLTDPGLQLGSTDVITKQRRSFSTKASSADIIKFDHPNSNWKGGTVCYNCSEVHLDINKHRLQHSSEILRACGFCEKSFTRKMGTNEHYQFIHKNRQHLCCKFCKNFSKGTERSYIQHFLTVHRDIARKAHTEAEIALMESNQAKNDVSDELKEQPVHKSTAMDVCKHCGRVFPKSFLKTHVLQHTQETMNRCGFCTQTFKDPTSARSHYRTVHRDSNNLSCVYCSILVGTLQEYIDHYMKVHHGCEKANSTPSENSETGEQYSICEFCTDVVRGIHGHYQRHALVDKLSCGFCGVKLATKNSVIRHYGAVHRDHEDLVCKRCSLKIGSEKKYIRHYIKRHLSEPSENDGHSEAVKDGQLCNNQLSIGNIEASSNKGSQAGADNSQETKKPALGQTHSDSDSDSFEQIVPNQYKCGMCDEAFEQKYLLKMHRRVHSCARYKCDLCDVELFGEGDLNRHKRNVHNQQVEKQCDECGEVFPNTKKFRAHLKKHSNYYPFSCTECPKKFKEKINLCNHVKRFHTPDAKYRFNCSSCNKGFDNEGMYQSHLRIHTDERPFVCEICGNGFRTKISLKVHQNIHTDNRPYKCKFCGKGFRQQSTMQNHRRIHTGETPFMCHICGRSFHDRGHFHAHKKSSHKNDTESTAPKKRAPNFKIPSQVPQKMPPLPHSNASIMVTNNLSSHTEVNTAVQSIIEPPTSQRAYPQHPQNVLDYQNYFNQMFYPQASWMNQPK